MHVYLFVAMLTGLTFGGCSPSPSEPGTGPITGVAQEGDREGDNNAPKVSNIREAFQLGAAKIEKEAFAIDNVDCKLTIERSKRGWLMTARRTPSGLGGELLVVIEPNGEVTLAPGL